MKIFAATSKTNYAYIDGANLDKGTAELGWRVDYNKFYVWLKDKFRIDTAYIFIGYVPKYENLYNKMRTAGFTLVFKDTSNIGYGQIKGNCDADLILRVARDVYETSIDRAIIVSSDGDFSCLIKFLQEKKKAVTILSPSRKCSIFLMRTGSAITYLDDVKAKIFLDRINPK
jgi:uncharacterized LabA/DUF88 family protein